MSRPSTAQGRQRSLEQDSVSSLLLNTSNRSLVVDDLGTLGLIEERIQQNILRSDVLSRYFSNEKIKEQNELIKSKYLQSLVKLSETEVIEESYKAINDKYIKLEDAYTDMRKMNEQLLESLKEAKITINQLSGDLGSLARQRSFPGILPFPPRRAAPSRPFISYLLT